MTTNGRFAPVRIAVVGLGYWGPNIVRNLYELPEAELMWLCDLDRLRLDRLGLRYPAVGCTSDYDEILRDPAVEAIAISTPIASHYELARAAVDAGKHVLVEKPMAPSSREAMELTALAEAGGVVLMPGHTFVYSPPVNLVRDLIRSGELGEIYFISSSRVNLGLHQADVSVVWDLGPHDFSILCYWLEEQPAAVSATSRGCVLPDMPDVAFVNLDYPSGAIANVHLSWLAPTKLRQTVVVGSRKMVVYDDGSREPVRIHDSGAVLDDPESFGEYRLTYRTGPIVSPPVEAAEPLALELADFCRVVRLGGEPRSSARLGTEVIRIVEAVERALAAGGSSVVEAPLPERWRAAPTAVYGYARDGR
jgi:predicted dehydrogenase